MKIEYVFYLVLLLSNAIMASFQASQDNYIKANYYMLVVICATLLLGFTGFFSWLY